MDTRVDRNFEERGLIHGYRWWTVMRGNSALYGYYLKLGPLTICVWGLAPDWFVDVCFLNRWGYTI